MKILLAADVHLGRIPVRLMEGAQNAADYCPARAFQTLVDTAIDHQVAAVVLAGDIVDDDRDFYEAFSDLRAGVERLLEANIRCIAIAGNHDVDILPRLAAQLPDMEFIGQDGQWSHTTISDGTHGLNLVAWSFPEKIVQYSALTSVGETLAAIPQQHRTYVLVHGALDDHASHYHPLKREDLNALPVDGYWLGHNHEPHDLDADRSGYLGSISALRRSEQGWRGAWLFDVANDTMSRVSVSPLRYDTIHIDISDLHDHKDIEGEISTAVIDFHDTHDLAAPLAAVGLHVHFEGRHNDRAALRTHVQASHTQGRQLLRHNAITYFLTGTSWEVGAQHDIPNLAQGVGTIAEIAKRIQLLDNPHSDEAQALLNRFKQQLEQAERLGHKSYDQLSEPYTDEQLTEVLVDALSNVLDQALSGQRS